LEVAVVGALVAEGDVTGETTRSNTVRSVVIMSGFLLW